MRTSGPLSTPLPLLPPSAPPLHPSRELPSCTRPLASKDSFYAATGKTGAALISPLGERLGPPAAALGLQVGDHFQLQPFSKWQAASSNRYNVSLMERLVTSGMHSAMLTEQYRMHPDISRVVSRCFYSSKLTTAPPTAAARCHPLPVAFIEAGKIRGLEDL